MVFNPLYGYALAFAVGASGAWYVQGLRWGSDMAEREALTTMAISENVDAVNKQLIASRAQTESLRMTFLEYKAGKENETNALERAVADGTKRLRVKARCPEPVPSTGTVPSGAGSGQPELDAAARFDYYALRGGLDRQYGLLQFCRAELRKRSAR